MADSDRRETLSTLANGLDNAALNLERIIESVATEAAQWRSEGFEMWTDALTQYRNGIIDEDDVYRVSTEYSRILRDEESASLAVEAVQRARDSILEAATLADRDNDPVEDLDLE